MTTLTEDVKTLESEIIALNQQIGSGQAPPDISSLLPLVATIKSKVPAEESPPAEEATTE